MMGGALRQAGIVAAGCRWALEHHVDRLAEDHAHARILAEGLAGLPGITLDPATVETNIVVFRLADAASSATAWRPGTGCGWARSGPDLVRAVTHHDVDTTGVHRAIDAATVVLSGRRGGTAASGRSARGS